MEKYAINEKWPELGPAGIRNTYCTYEMFSILIKDKHFFFRKNFIYFESVETLFIFVFKKKVVKTYVVLNHTF